LDSTPDAEIADSPGATVTAPPIIHKTLTFILLAVALLLGAAVQSADAALPDVKGVSTPVVRVNCCHPAPEIETSMSHNPTRVCHHSAPQPSDLNYPEYRQGYQAAYLLLKEPRTPDPQSKAGQPFVIAPTPRVQLHSPLKVSRASRHSLICLRSDILLH
jgi:hypothetical protein